MLCHKLEGDNREKNQTASAKLNRHFAISVCMPSDGELGGWGRSTRRLNHKTGATASATSTFDRLVAASLDLWFVTRGHEVGA
jgi:hypothetical protein